MRAQQMVGHLVRRLHQHSTQVFASRTQAAGFDLTQVQFAALDAIQSEPGIDQARVASRIAYDRATTGGVIDRLEKKGLIERRVSPRDRRARSVALSAAGERLFEQMQPIVALLQDDILPGLTPAEQAQFLTLAARVLDAFDEEKKD